MNLLNFFTCWICAAAALLASASTHAEDSKPIILLDKELSNFEAWIGVPHAEIKNLPQGTYQSSNIHNGTPLGLNALPGRIFRTIELDGELVLYVSGEIYAGLTTLEDYENYHFSTQLKWGEKKWPPRETAKRDSGILYHCYGDHGRFWQVWKTSIEYQVQETDLRDFISLGGNTATPKKVGGPLADIRANVSEASLGEIPSFDPFSEDYLLRVGYIQAGSAHDAPHGEWNHLEIYTVGNYAVHLVNGHIVIVVENVLKPDGSPLTKGQVQIQSEAAECYYKDMIITPINDFPESMKSKIRFK